MKLSKKLAITLSVLTFSCSIGSAQLLIEFTEVGNDVRLDVSGTIELLSSNFTHDAPHTDDFTNWKSVHRDEGFGVYSPGQKIDDHWVGTDCYDINFSDAFVVYDLDSSTLTGSFAVTGNEFAAFSDGDSAIIEDGVANVTSYSVNGSAFYRNASFESLDLARHATDVDIALWCNIPDDESGAVFFRINTVNSAPEPSSAALLGLGALGLLIRRKR